MQEGLKLVRVEHGKEGDILIRLISKYGKVDTHVSSIEDLILEIKKLNPDAVEVDMGLYDRIGGIDTLNFIRSAHHGTYKGSDHRKSYEKKWIYKEKVHRNSRDHFGDHEKNS